MAGERTLDVAALMEGKLSRPQIGIALWLCSLMVLEGYDMQALSFATPADPALQARLEAIDSGLRAQYGMTTNQTAVGVLDLEIAAARSGDAGLGAFQVAIVLLCLRQSLEHGHRIVGVHVNDWREPTRGWADRIIPGDGVADIAGILAALERAGWRGDYDLEIFSDNGTFGNAYPDSLWNVEPRELVRRSRESFMHCWQERRVAA